MLRLSAERAEPKNGCRKSQKEAMNAIQTQDHAELRDYLRPIWDRRWIVLLIVVAVTGITYAYNKSKPNEYTAGSTVFVTSSSAEQTVIGQVVLPSDDRNVQNQAALIESPSVAGQAAELMHYRGDPRALLKGITTTTRTNSDFIDIHATDRNPQRAAALANGFGRGYIKLSTTTFQKKVKQSLDVAKHQLNDTRNLDKATRKQLEDQVRQLQAYASVPAGTAQLAATATPPTAPSAPKPLRNAAFAFLLSLLLALFVAYGLDRLDRRLKILDDVERAFQVPILATIPHSNKPAPLRDGAATLGDQLKESFRSLRTNIRLASIDGPLRKILVTSALPGEGKSTIVRNLAITYAELGLRVAVIDADLRNPSLAKLFQVERSPGVTDVLVGSVDGEEAFHMVPAHVPGAAVARMQTAAMDRRSGGMEVALLETHSNGRSFTVDDAESVAEVALLPSGPQPPNPPAVLAGEAMHRLIDQVAADHDVLIIDSAPLLAVSDTIPLLSLVDGTIIVSRLGLTTSTAARRLLDLIQRVPQVQVLGIAVNDVTDEAFPGGYSYYGYYGYGRPSGD